MDTRVIVLAAGRGTRMNSETPKVLMHVNGQPMIQHLLDSIVASGVDPRPVVVVGHNRELLRQTLGDKYEYAYQEQTLGTGHAVQCAQRLFAGRAKDIIVLYGDHPFVQMSTIAKIHALHKSEKRVLSMMTTTVEDFEGWRSPFADFGRVIRDASGRIAAITEFKDATPDERNIHEVNPSFFAFQADWLWLNLGSLKNNNAKHEFYLTDLVRIAIDQGKEIASIDISPLESIGINTPEHLELAKTLIV